MYEISAVWTIINVLLLGIPGLRPYLLILMPLVLISNVFVYTSTLSHAVATIGG